jgi:thymidylate synthase
MRSNDAIFGYKGDFAWQKHVQNKLANDLGIESGDLIWTAGSFHVYQRHFYLLEEDSQRNIT